MSSILIKELPSTQLEMLRIGMFSESFDPVQNGVTTSVLTLVAALRACNQRVCVFAPAPQAKREPELNVLRFPSFVSAFNKEYPLAFPFLPRLALATHFNRLRLNIVHTHTPFVLGLTGANLAISRNVPLVSTFHTLYSQYSHYVPVLPDTVTQTLLEHYLPWYYNRCVEIMCPSQVAANALRALGVERPIEVVPTGVPMPPPEAISRESRNRSRAELGLGSDTPVLLFAGRLAKEKNIQWLFEAFVKIQRQIPEVVLLIAGGGPYFDDLQLLTREMQIEQGVRFLGPAPRKRLDALYATADVFCFPSPSETQGLVVGEARAAGVPCVVVNAGGAPENVVDGVDGFCVPPDAPDMFAYRVLQLLLNPPLLARFRENALQNAMQYTPEQMVKRVLTVYERARTDTPPVSSALDDVDADTMKWEAVGHSFYENPNGSGDS